MRGENPRAGSITHLELFNLIFPAGPETRPAMQEHKRTVGVRVNIDIVCGGKYMPQKYLQHTHCGCEGVRSCRSTVVFSARLIAGQVATCQYRSNASGSNTESLVEGAGERPTLITSVENKLLAKKRGLRIGPKLIRNSKPAPYKRPLSARYVSMLIPRVRGMHLAVAFQCK
jgi:hypothetical protein